MYYTRTQTTQLAIKESVCCTVLQQSHHITCITLELKQYYSIRMPYINSNAIHNTLWRRHYTCTQMQYTIIHTLEYNAQLPSSTRIQLHNYCYSHSEDIRYTYTQMQFHKNKYTQIQYTTTLVDSKRYTPTVTLYSPTQLLHSIIKEYANTRVYIVVVHCIWVYVLHCIWVYAL